MRTHDFSAKGSGCRLRALLLAVFSLFSTPASASVSNDAVLSRLLSPDEGARHAAMAEARGRRFTRSQIAQALAAPAHLNVSTLIYILMAQESGLIHALSSADRALLESSPGSFPNIAYYYARVSPEKGVPELLRLFHQHPDQRLPVCKALGETRRNDAIGFLLGRSRSEEMDAASLFAVFAGLKTSRRALPHTWVLEMLGRPLDRESLLLLSAIQADFSQTELIDLCEKGGPQHRYYAIQHIFASPGRHFLSLRRIIESALLRGEEDQVRQFLMSDPVRRSPDPRLTRYRKEILEKLSAAPSTPPARKADR